MTSTRVQRISDAIAMSVRYAPATLAMLGNQIRGFSEPDSQRAYVWYLNGFPLGAHLSEAGIDGLLHAVHNRRVAIKFCNRSAYPYDELLFNSPIWIPVQLARPQSANFYSLVRPHIFHACGSWTRLLYEIEPDARYLKMAGPTRIPRPAGGG